MSDRTDEQSVDIVIAMTAILGTMMLVLGGLLLIQIPRTSRVVCIFADKQAEPSKRSYEQWVAIYTPIWIIAFAVIVAFQLYESFSTYSYLLVCGGLALPFLLQPVLFPSGAFDSPDQHRPLHQRYSFKANVWIAIYSFIGNYYYTHYFYSVLKAKYTMPAHRLNNVPIALYFATHFYFSTYHLFSNILLRLVETSFAPSLRRSILFVAVIFVFSYLTAFLETLTISSYPYYSFEDRNAAYVVGSAFYGIYFLVSFPAFYYFDRDVDTTDGRGEDQEDNGASEADVITKTRRRNGVSLWETIVSSCGHGMIILTMLDLVRLSLGIPLVMEVTGSGNALFASPNSCMATSS
jgi:cycloeucalenol cycloisomerase